MAGMSGPMGGYSIDTLLTPRSSSISSPLGSSAFQSSDLYTVDPFGRVQSHPTYKTFFSSAAAKQSKSLDVGLEQMKESAKTKKALTELLLGEGGLIKQLLGSVSGPNIDPNYGAGQRAALDRDFDIAMKNAIGQLESRGLGGSSLVGAAAASVAGEKQIATGLLEDRLLREQLSIRQSVLPFIGQLLSIV